ncbi:MAG: hypothetical protein ACAI38_16710 [Myxococcota bacterium]|nr:hypothetical protein [Myxococcota bacterium]
MLVTALAALLVASPAGGVFAGPTQANGSTVYWGPAVLGMSKAPHAVYIEARASYIHVGYQREPEDASTEPLYPRETFGIISPVGALTAVASTPWPELRVFAGVFSPTTAGTRWRTDGPTRYHVTDSTAFAYAAPLGAIWTVSPRVAVAIGGGPMFVSLDQQASYDFGAYANRALPSGAQLFPFEDPELEGSLELDLHGWSTLVLASVYAKPADNFAIALSGFLPQTPRLGGRLALTAPPSLADAVPVQIANPTADFRLTYPIPWALNAEAELTTGRMTFALLAQMQGKSRQRLILGRVVTSDSALLRGDQVSVRESRNEYTVGLRGSYKLDSGLELASRFDVTPRNTPREAVSPLNIDFTLMELNLGARIPLTESITLEATYGAVLGIPVHVESSIFNPRADTLSGFALPSARGDYTVWAQKVIVGCNVAFGG